MLLNETLYLDVTPTPKARPRVTSRGTYTPQKTKKNSDDIRLELRKKWKHKPIEGPLAIDVKFVIKRPKSVSKKKRKYPTVTPDLDNLIKQVGDASNGILWVDDSQIVAIASCKVYDDNSDVGIYITISEIDFDKAL